MGHRQRVGIVSEAEMYGGKLLRIDIPVMPADGQEAPKEPYVTEYYGTSAIYSLEPIAEEVARARYIERDPRPVNPLGFRDPTPEEVQAEVQRRAERMARQGLVDARGPRPGDFASDDNDMPF
jgi:hypothetical protein